jgi:hypothetical protein
MFAIRHHATARSLAFMLPTPSRRRRTNETGENPSQMALIGESANDRNLGGRDGRFEQRRFGLLYPA